MVINSFSPDEKAGIENIIDETYIPKIRFHFTTSLNGNELSEQEYLFFANNLGCDIDCWNTVIKQSEYIRSWDVEKVIGIFCSQITQNIWEAVKMLSERFDAENMLSVEIWFFIPPSLSLSNTILKQLSEHHVELDFDLYPLK